MKLKPNQIKKLSSQIFQKLISKNSIDVLSSERKAVECIENVFLADARKEEEIENEAKKMMEKFEKQVASGEIEYHKMYSMIKKQLMREKKFTP